MGAGWPLPQRVFAAAALWGALWSLGLVAILAPRLPRGVDPLGVLFVGGVGFAAGGILNGALTFAYRDGDLTEIGVGGFGLFSEGMAAGIAHVLATSWIACRLVFAQDGGSFFFGFPGPADVIAVLAGLITLPVWAYVGAVVRLVTKAGTHVLFLLTDLVTIPLAFWLFLKASQGIG